MKKSNTKSTTTNTTKTETELEVIANIKINSNPIYAESFRFISTGSFDATKSAVKAFYHIGQIVNFFSEKYNQRESATLRKITLKDLNLSNNEITGCKKINSEFLTCQDAIEAYKATGKKSLNAARIWAALREESEESEEKKSDPLKALTAALDKAVKSEDVDKSLLVSLLEGKLKELR